MLEYLLLVRSFKGGGAERVMVNLANALAAAGHSVLLAVGNGDGPFRAEVSAKVRVVDFEASSMGNAARALRRLLKAEEPQIGISTTTNVNLQLLAARFLTGFPKSVYVRESGFARLQISTQKGLVNRILDLGIRFLYKLGQGILVPAEAMRKDMIDYFGHKAASVHVLPSPVVTSELERLSQEDSTHAWLKDETKPVILGVGRLQKPKDFQTLLRAAAQVNQNRPVYVIILGQGPELEELKSLAKDLGMASQVDFPGFVNNPFSYFSKADVYVLSSQTEGLPNTLIQAMACGCPVVSVDCVSGPREILEDGKWGPLVPIGDAAALARAIESVLDRPLDSESLKGRSRYWTDGHSIELLKEIINKNTKKEKR